MSVYAGPEIANDGLVLSLDAANQKSFGPISVEYLIVAGGGSGGSGEANPAGDSPGGGGGGGVLTGTVSVTLQSYTISVGAGASTRVTGTSQNGLNGQNSSAFGLTALGGGAGGREEGPGFAGGSGGGGGGSCTSGRKAGGAGTSGQGNSGGTGGDNGCTRRAGAGGGGAGAIGGDDRGNLGGDGGAGLLSTITGIPTFYAGGGGGGNAANVGGTPGQGGLGGGGAGGTSPSGPGTDATPNTGGGGGGTGSGTSLINGLGGSGIVVIRYSGAQKATGGTITTVGGDTVHTFTSSGTFTPGAIWGDVSRNGNNGTLVNGVGYNSGNNGRLVFNGSNTYATIPNPITSSGPYSVIQWVRPAVALTDTTNSGSRKTPLVGPGPVWNPGYWLTARVFRVHAATEYRDVTINWVGDTGWHQIGQIFDGITCSTIIDGQVLLGTRTAYSPGTPTSILIGAETTAGSAVNWNGDISGTAFYNRVLTATEVLQNFNALKGRYFGYQSVTYTASANMTLTNNGTQDVTMFKNTNNNSWNGEVRSTESFSAPCTIEFSKQSGTTDNGASYLMIGWNEDPTTNTSYTSIDHASYPYQQNSYVVYNNGGSAIVLGPWDQNKRFYIVYDTDGFIRHYNGSTLLYSANYGTNKTVFVDSSFYSVNSTFGGLTNVKVARSSWNGFSYV